MSKENSTSSCPKCRSPVKKGWEVCPRCCTILAESADQEEQPETVAVNDATLKEDNILMQARPDQDKAQEHITKAESFCQAAEFDEAIEKEQSLAQEHLEKAKKLSLTAEFEQAQEHIRQAQGLWPKLEGVTDIDIMVVSSRTNYNANVVNARKYFNQKTFQEALESCEKALKLCPHAEEAKVLLDQIKRKKYQERQRREDIREDVALIKRWVAIFAVGVGILAASITFAVFTWRWFGLSGEIFFVLMVAHVIYYIIAWPSSKDAIIFSIIALVATGIITLIISSIAVFIFKASWLTGISIGLWPGILICLASILWGAFLITDQR